MIRQNAQPESHPVVERPHALDPSLHLAAIVDSADDAIISKDLDGIVRSWNSAACRIFGYSADEMIGQSILRLIPEDLRGEEDEILRKLRAGERIEHYETTRKKKNGETFDVSVTISPIRDKNDRIIGASKIARDISMRKQMERVLVQSEKLAATGRMAAAIAHEINNPLDALMNLIFLARKSSKNQPTDEYLRLAEQELRRVAHTARQTLGFYREEVLPVKVYIHDLIESILAVYRPKMASATISVDTHFNDLQKVLVKKGEMVQIFSNIIVNAMDAMQNGGGTLRVSTRKVTASTGDGIQVVVEDTGAGINRESLQRIFEAFFTTKGNLGTGIGLWVTRQLVESRGGRISVISSTEAGNSGTNVTVFIPFAVPMVGSLREEKSTKLFSEDNRLTLVSDCKTGTSS